MDFKNQWGQKVKKEPCSHCEQMQKALMCGWERMPIANTCICGRAKKLPTNTGDKSE